MFTGIISDTGTITASEDGGRRITVHCRFNWRALWIGESIACNGACLTVVARGSMKKGWFADPRDSWFTAELSDETLNCTVPGQWETGLRVNLETSLVIGDTLDGHLVTGHVDGLARLVDVTSAGDSYVLTLEAPETLKHFIVPKGSVTLDGVSLTVNTVENTRFKVNIISHTWKITTLGQRKAGDALNLEVDMIARYLDRLLARQS